jgi:hypothetical protein
MLFSGVLPRGSALMWFLVLPSAVYLALFCLLTYPLMRSFSTQFFTNAGDGLQNVWNLWWVNRAVTVLHTSPWFTGYLYFPSGTTLIGHTLNPFNGFVSVLLLRLLTLVEAHNVIVVFSFVMGGVAACWLSYAFCEHYWASIIGGSVFTFSEYHFAHADGHLQLLSLEWLPVFALTWYLLIQKPSFALSVASALALLLVILCDFYYFAYSLAYASIVAGYEAVRRRDPVFLVREPHTRPFLLFVVLSAMTSGRLLFRLLFSNAVDPFLGSHDPGTFSTDLLAPIIPGGHWRFAELTRPFWDTLPGNIQESSVDLGFAVLAALVYLVVHRSHHLVRRVGPWWSVLLVFWMLSLGPVLRIWGTPFPGVPMPYAALQSLLPAVNLSGVPARMMVMVTLAAAVLTSSAFALLLRGSMRSRVAACGLLLLLTFEYLPRPIPTTWPEVPGYVFALRGIDGAGGVLDLVSGYWSDRPFGSDGGAGIALYYQTIHQRPMASGYVARVPTSVRAVLLEQRRFVGENAYGALCRDYDLRYLVVPHAGSPIAALASAQLLFSDRVAQADLFDLAPQGLCVP